MIKTLHRNFIVVFKVFSDCQYSVDTIVSQQLCLLTNTFVQFILTESPIASPARLRIILVVEIVPRSFNLWIYRIKDHSWALASRCHHSVAGVRIETVWLFRRLLTVLPTTLFFLEPAWISACFCSLSSARASSIGSILVELFIP